jgi:ankyrin repeat protein/beta-lactamase regulating signal transducer with metallopeptidase domain
MNQVINKLLVDLNNIGSVFCQYTAGVLIQSTLLIVILFGVDLILRRRVRAVFRYCIWMLVLVKLVLPPTLSLPTGIGYWTADHLPAHVTIVDRPFSSPGFEPTGLPAEMPPVRPSQERVGNDPLFIPVNTALTPLTWPTILFLFWIVGVLAFLVLLMQRIHFVRGLVIASRPAEESLLSLLAQCRRQVGLHRDVRLRLSEAIPSPAVCGLLKPTVLIPTGLVEKLPMQGLKAILIHELAHIKRGDLWVNSIQTVLQLVYFYNPFVWYANAIIRKTCEEAVDETVLVTLAGEAKDYSNTLIDIGEMAFGRVDLGLRLIGVAESKKALKWRIRHMLNRPIPKSAKVGVFGTIVIITVAATLLPMAKAEKSGVDQKPAVTVKVGKSAQALYQAAADGDIEQVRLLISRGADVNDKDSMGKAPLHYACEKGHTELAKLLISRGAGVNAVSSDRRWSPDFRKPLHYAVMGGHKQTVELLLSEDADFNSGYGQPWFEAMRSSAAGHKEVVEVLVARGAEFPALHLAAYRGDMEELRKLLEEGADVNAPAMYDTTVLHAAANGGNKDVVEFLISEGAKVDARDSFRLAPLYYAALHNYEDIVDLLLDKGMDINAKDEYGNTLFYYAVLNDGDKGKDAIKTLISKGANVNAKGLGGYTPLNYAIWLEYKGIVELLIHNGADVNAEDMEGFGPYYHAVMQGRKDFVELLTAKGATPVSTIHLAARLGDLEKVKAFVEKGADINAKDKSGETPLFSAVHADNSDVARFLLAKGADVKAKDPSGHTPLHYVSVRDHKDLAKVLIARGADVNAKNKNDETPLHDAAYYDRREMAELFIAKGANVDAKSTRRSVSGITPLYIVSSRGYKDVAELLIEKGADVKIKDSNSQTPLHLASVRGHGNVVEMLTAKGADVNAKDNKEETPLSLAKAQGHDQIVGFLVKHGATE